MLDSNSGKSVIREGLIAPAVVTVPGGSEVSNSKKHKQKGDQIPKNKPSTNKKQNQRRNKGKHNG